MIRLTEDKLAHDFPGDWHVIKYDATPYYKNQFKDCCLGNKAVDFIAYDPRERALWLIELKDYRIHRRTKQIPLWEEMAIKVRDTLAGLFTARTRSTCQCSEFMKKMNVIDDIRVVLHLEQAASLSKLFPRAFDPADVQQKLKQLIKPIDAHPKLIELSRQQAVCWKVISVSDNK